MPNHTTKQLELPLFEVKIPLSKKGKHAGKYTTVVSVEDKDLARLNWNVSITKNTQYAIRNIYKNSKYIGYEAIHRVIMEEMLGHAIPDGYEVDHRDGNGLNNRRSNLRLASHAQNKHNSRKQSNNTSGYKGVTWHKPTQKWQAKIKVNGKNKHLGLFNSKEDAHQAYCEAADELHGRFANYGE